MSTIEKNEIVPQNLVLGLFPQPALAGVFACFIDFLETSF